MLRRLARVLAVAMLLAALPGAAHAAPRPHTVGTSSVVLHVPVLEYHRFLPSAAEVRAKRGYDVTPTEFDAQLTALQQAGWHTITASTLARDLQAGTPPPAHTFVITIDDGYSDGYTEALPVLQRHGMVATYFIIGGRIGDHPRPDAVSLDAAQIQALAKAGMEIGNHTDHHVHLGQLSARVQRREIRSASTRLTAITGVRPVTMAYPFGSYNADTPAAAAGAGIMLAFDSHHAAVETWAGRYSVPRLRVGPSVSGKQLVAMLAAAA